MAGYGSNFQAELGSFFGLNPLLPTAVSQQIESTGLAAGYGYGSDNLNRYREFATGAFEKFQLSPGETQQMFQYGVINAGASLKSLSDALQTTADYASKAGVSFQQAQKNLASGIQMYSDLGFGSNTTGAAAAWNVQFGSGRQGQLLTNQLSKPLQQFEGSMVGQALIANQLGIPFTQMYSYSQSKADAGGLGEQQALNQVMVKYAESFGLRPGATQGQIDNATQQMTYLMGALGMNLPPTVVNTYLHMLTHPDKHGEAKAIAAAAGPKPSFWDYYHVPAGYGKESITFHPGLPESGLGPSEEQKYQNDMRDYHKRQQDAKAAYEGKASRAATDYIQKQLANSVSGGYLGTILIKTDKNLVKSIQVSTSNSSANYGVAGRAVNFVVDAVLGP
jgi:hypothetical protein